MYPRNILSDSAHSLTHECPDHAIGCDCSIDQCPANTIDGQTWTCFNWTMSGVRVLYSAVCVCVCVCVCV